MADIDGLAGSEQRWGRERLTWDPDSSDPHFGEGGYEGGHIFPVDSSIFGEPLKPLYLERFSPSDTGIYEG